MAGTSQIECCQVYEAATVVIPVLQRRELRHREVKYLSKVTQLEEVLGIKPTGAGLSGDGGAGGQGRVVPAGRGGWEGEEQRASGTKEDSTAGAERARKDRSYPWVDSIKIELKSLDTLLAPKNCLLVWGSFHTYIGIGSRNALQASNKLLFSYT